MFTRRWIGVLLAVVVCSSAVRVAAAQETPSKDQEIEDLRRRLEALENASAKATADVPGGGLADPNEEKWFDRVKIGGGIRTSLQFDEEDAGNGKDLSRLVSLDSARIYASAKITDNISATLNTEFDGGNVGPLAGSGVRILDAIVQFHFMDEFNIWVGHFLPP